MSKTANKLKHKLVNIRIFKKDVKAGDSNKNKSLSDNEGHGNKQKHSGNKRGTKIKV